MNSEPPIGDDLQQMLVTMKRNVLGRLTDTPRRAPIHRRVAIVAAIVALVGVGTASGAVALGMVPAPFTAKPAATTATHSPTQPAPASPTPSTATQSATPTAAPATTPSTTPTPVVATIPNTCGTAVPASSYSRLFGSLVEIQLRPALGATPQPYYIAPDEAQYANTASLVCAWDPTGGTEDVDNLVLQIGTVDRSILTARLQTLATKGWTCTDRLEGRMCQQSSSTVYYDAPVHTTFTFFVRGSTWIEIEQSNVPTNGLLDALVQQLWK